MKRTDILLPLDGSEFSRRAMEHVIELFAPDHCAVTLLRVGSLPTDVLTKRPHTYVPDGWSQMTTDFRSEADRDMARHPVIASQVWDNSRTELLDSLEADTARLRSKGFQVQALARFGDPVEEIVTLAETGRFDLIVMATHGRSGLRRVWMGSVAKGVLERVTLDVLLVQTGRASARADGDASQVDHELERV